MDFHSVRHKLEDQFSNISWVPGSGLDKDGLFAVIDKLENSYTSAAMIRAEAFRFIAENARLAIDTDDIFQDKLDGNGLIKKLRIRWEKALKEARLPEEMEEVRKAKEDCTFHANSDYSHTSPNSRLLLELGFSGLRQRVLEAARCEGLTEKQREFYRSCDIMLTAMNTAALRLSEAVAPYNEANSIALRHIAQGAPQNTYEALQLLILYFFMHDYIFGTRIRTLGRLDVLLTPFYRRDIAAGTYSEEEIAEMLKFFLHKFWAAKVPYDLPFCLCGMDEDGNEVTNEVTGLILRCYNELNIYSPKIHIRVSSLTPPDVMKQVLSYIRGGNSSFVFLWDDTVIRGLTRVGIEEKDARNYVPIGCYEPAVWGMELGCTGCGGINLPKALELVLLNGRHYATGEPCGPETGEIQSFEDLLDAVKAQISHLVNRATNYITKIEPYYGTVNPDPLLSCQYEDCLRRGVDIYDGGAKYNNSSLSFYSLASLVDSLCAIKALVFEEKALTLPQLTEVLKNNWKDQPLLRARALKLPEKFGVNNPVADELSVALCVYCSGLVTGRPNGRGGVFKAALYTIDHCVKLGENTMATPDGRLAGTPLSKNLCAVTGMDRKGVTGLIHSAGKLDHSLFPNGTVLDVVLHPSAVAGEEGLEAFYSIIMTYLKMGGLAIHGNVFHPEDLKKAQADPESYKNLQVRVCGWNAYFVNLSKVEQDAFIQQAENAL